MADFDAVILRFVQPFVDDCRARAWIDGYFFVRYFLDGPHIRLRLKGDAKRLRTLVQPALLHRALTCSDEGSLSVDVRWVPYDPETDRYGGDEALVVAERVFNASSDAACELVKGLGSRPSSRLGQGLLAIVAATRAFFPEREQAAHFAECYAVGYLHRLSTRKEEQRALFNAFDDGFDRQASRLASVVEMTFEQLGTSEVSVPWLTSYYAALKHAEEQLARLAERGAVVAHGHPLQSAGQCAEYVVPSYIHMMSNRIGLSVKEETYLSHLVRRSLPVRELT